MKKTLFMLLVVPTLALSSCSLFGGGIKDHDPDEHFYRDPEPISIDDKNHGQWCEYHQTYENVEPHDFEVTTDHPGEGYNFDQMEYRYIPGWQEVRCKVCGFETHREEEMPVKTEISNTAEFKSNVLAVDYSTFKSISSYYNRNDNPNYLYSKEGYWHEYGDDRFAYSFTEEVEKMKDFIANANFKLYQFGEYFIAETGEESYIAFDNNYRLFTFRLDHTWGNQYTYDNGLTEAQVNVRRAALNYGHELPDFSNPRSAMKLIMDKRDMNAFAVYVSKQHDENGVSYYGQGHALAYEKGYLTNYVDDTYNYNAERYFGFEFKNGTVRYLSVPEYEGFSQDEYVEVNADEYYANHEAFKIAKEAYQAINSGYTIEYAYEGYPILVARHNGVYYGMRMQYEPQGDVAYPLAIYKFTSRIPQNMESDWDYRVTFDFYHIDDNYGHFPNGNRDDLMAIIHPSHSTLIDRYDDTHHWQECSVCGEISGDKHAHDMGHYTYVTENNVEYRVDTCSGCEYSTREVNVYPKIDPTSDNINYPTHAQIDTAISNVAYVTEHTAQVQKAYEMNSSYQVALNEFSVESTAQVITPQGDNKNAYFYAVNTGDIATYAQKTGNSFYQYKEYLGVYNTGSSYTYQLKALDDTIDSHSVYDTRVLSHVNSTMNELKSRMYDVETFLTTTYSGFTDSDMSHITYKYIDNGDNTFKCEVSGYATKLQMMSSEPIDKTFYIVADPNNSNKECLTINFNEDGLITSCEGVIEMQSEYFTALYAYLGVSDLPFIDKIQFSITYDYSTPIVKKNTLAA